MMRIPETENIMFFLSYSHADVEKYGIHHIQDIKDKIP